MNRFDEALLAGMKNAEDADRNCRAIQQAIQELTDAVSKISDAKVTVALSKVAQLPPGSNFITAIAESWLNANYVDAISLKKTSEPHNTIEIARIDIPATGFPCRLFHGKRRVTCSDQEALIRELQEVLSSVETGQALISLMKDPEEVQGAVDSPGPPSEAPD